MCNRSDLLIYSMRLYNPWWCGNWTLPWLESRMATPGCDPERYILFQSEKQHYLKSLHGKFSKHRTKNGCSCIECLEWIFWVFATPPYIPCPFGVVQIAAHLDKTQSLQSSNAFATHYDNLRGRFAVVVFVTCVPGFILHPLFRFKES